MIEFIVAYLLGMLLGSAVGDAALQVVDIIK